MEAQIALAVRSIRLHYPEAAVVLLTNPLGREAALPAGIRVVAEPVDLERIMFERIRMYRDHVRAAPDSTQLVFLDTDMLVIRRFDEILAPGADLSVTVRRILPAPVNGGLIVVDTANHRRVAGFFDRFVACYDGLPEEEKRWDGDQTALRILLDAPVARLKRIEVGERDGLVVRFAPARIFNNTPRRLFLKLGLIRPGARLLHFKGGRKGRMAAYARRYLSPAFLAYARFMDGRPKRPA